MSVTTTPTSFSPTFADLPLIAHREIRIQRRKGGIDSALDDVAAAGGPA